MYELKVTNHKGEALSLSASKDYTVYKITGLTPPKAVVNRSANATMDGSAINSVRIDSRNIVIYMAINGDIEVNRIKLYKYFPPKKTITLYFKNGSRNVYIEGVVELIECSPFTKKEVAQISIICPQPYFRAVDYLITEFGDINNLFTFPFSIAEAGIEVSALVSNQRKSIINAGDIETGVIINLTAIDTVVNPVIYDVLKGSYIKLNFAMQAGDIITINTNSGQKSVSLLRDGLRQNVIGYRSPDSDWFILEAGDNVFTFDAEEGKSNLQIAFTTSLLYGGV